MLQEIMLIGRLGRDPEQRKTNQGTPVTSFSVATDRTWTDDNGQRQQRTVWFQISAWNRLADPCVNYLKKGSMVMVKGEMLEPRVYVDRQGVQRAGLQVNATLVKFLSSNGQPEPTEDDNPQHTYLSRGIAPEAQDDRVRVLPEDEVPF